MDKQTGKGVELLESRCLLKSAAVQVEEHHFRYKRRDGEWSPVMTRNTVSRGDAAAVILFERGPDRLHFVRQFRYPAYDPADPRDDGWLIELVAGMVDPGETPEDCIIREVAEETGFVIEAPRLIGRFYLSPAASRERAYLYYAEVSPERRAPPSADGVPGHYGTSDEDIETISMSIDEFLMRVERMDIADAKTLAAAEYLRRQRGAERAGARRTGA
jgi:nudix-type nucleoside diphosphatase (YffH/AdpP family)